MKESLYSQSCQQILDKQVNEAEELTAKEQFQFHLGNASFPVARGRSYGNTQQNLSNLADWGQVGWPSPRWTACLRHRLPAMESQPQFAHL